MITADTITDEQIRSCWTDFHNVISGRDLMAALREPIRDLPDWTDEEVRVARERCARALNFRRHVVESYRDLRGEFPPPHVVSNLVATLMRVDGDVRAAILNARAKAGGR